MSTELLRDTGLSLTVGAPDEGHFKRGAGLGKNNHIMGAAHPAALVPGWMLEN